MASIIFRNSSHKRKNRVNPDKLFEYDNFGVPDFVNRTLSGAFRDNIRIFLESFSEIQDYTVSEMPVWCTSLFSETDGVFPLYTLEETVQNSLYPFCDHCESAGWGHHFVCKRKYHFIISAKENWNQPLGEDFAEFDSHKLYGLIHCNGYGHLICINGTKNNSKLQGADDTMEFWDRLCTVLKARSISAHYVSRKDAIQLNLIHGVAYTQSWLAKWGYKFSGGITEHKYADAIRFLSKLSLDMVIRDLKYKTNSKRIREIIDTYRKLSAKPLFTMSDLLQFMLVFESRIPTDIYNACKFDLETGENVMDYELLLTSMTKNCRWPIRRLQIVLFVIVDLLKEHKADNMGSECRMSRQELRDGARKSIGDTGLIDFVLKSIKCFAVDDLIIRRSINPLSKIAEFAIAEFGSAQFNLSRDVWFVYENMVAEYPQSRTILDSNQFVKEWPITERSVGQAMVVVCKVLPSFDELEGELKRKLSPGEVVVVEPWMRVGDLKTVAQCALRDSYCVMGEFEVSQIGGLRKVEEGEMVGGVCEDGGQVWVRGRGLDLRTRLRYEDGGRRKTSQGNGVC